MRKNIVLRDHLIEAFQEIGFDDYKEIRISDIIFSEEVFSLCAKNTCGNFGRNHGCPPSAGNHEVGKARVLEYQNGFLLNKILPIKSREAMKESGQTLNRMRNELAKKFAGDRVLILGAGACKVCATCAALEGEPCRLPDKIQYSMEGSGILVMRMAMDYKMKYNAGMGNAGFFMLALYDE
jgi:predicted metal-binding protein